MFSLSIGVQSLQELCSEVIKCCLLQQRLLEPNHLHTKLPDYVPTRLKHSIIRHFKTSAVVYKHS